MSKILVKNGNWDKARAELGEMLERNKANFNAQFEATFASTRKPAVKAEPEPPKQSKAEAILGKDSRVSVLARSSRR